MATSLDGSSDDCPDSSSDAEIIVYVNDCSEPEIYCKPLTVSGATPLPSEGTNDAGTNTLLFGGLFAIGTALLLCIM